MTTLVETRQVSAGYGRQPVIEDITLAVESGVALGVVGPNAVGKSTLLRVLVGAQAPMSGEIRLGGRLIREIPARERARHVALVPQSVRYDIDFTVREMIALGRAPRSMAWGLESVQDQEIIANIIKTTELTGLENRPFSDLSGGERQRVLFARALAQEAEVLLLDEPTAHLDLAHQLLVIDRVRAHTARGGAAVVVLHDLTLAMKLDRVAIIDGGKLVALGRPEAVLDEARLAAVWGVNGALESRDGGWALTIRGRIERA